MTHQNIIILQNTGTKIWVDKTPEAWGSLTDLCRHHPEFSYEYIKKFKFPFEYKGYAFYKVPFRQTQ